MESEDERVRLLEVLGWVSPITPEIGSQLVSGEGERVRLWELLGWVSMTLDWQNEDAREDAIQDAWVKLEESRKRGTLSAQNPTRAKANWALRDARRAALAQATPNVVEVDITTNSMANAYTTNAAAVLEILGLWPNDRPAQILAAGTVTARVAQWITHHPGQPTTLAAMARAVGASYRQTQRVVTAMLERGEIDAQKVGRLTAYREQGRGNG